MRLRAAAAGHRIDACALRHGDADGHRRAASRNANAHPAAAIVHANANRAARDLDTGFATPRHLDFGTRAARDMDARAGSVAILDSDSRRPAARRCHCATAIWAGDLDALANRDANPADNRRAL